ncbi:MAG: DUF2274 domain-containing protein [Caulobacteraceae bacterium]|nr:DUF2274 domain-containing protein [Caulobacteraceae bacterium]
MADLRLAKLPDRTPVKITVTVPPALNAALRDYAAIYRATYGETESVADLIPFMLESFLAADRAFAQSRKAPPLDAPADAPIRRRRGETSSARQDPEEGG